jgi:ubiquinone/menaquinone biosynthesis C-methylase UbiE
MEKAKATQVILEVHENTRYYDDAAQEEAVALFWGEKSKFLPYFLKLKCETILELAVGWGRHVPMYMDRANKIIVVDALAKNIHICRERFAGMSKIGYYVNNGVDLSDLGDNSFDSIFSYDAMVHFELIDIWGYLKETARVLAPGGRALYHYSNYSEHPTHVWTQNPHNRNFMSNAIFTHLADRAGLVVLEQGTVSWGGQESLDGITLLEKPAT